PGAPMKAGPSRSSASNWPVATISAKAMATSRPEPALRRCVGARLTVVRACLTTNFDDSRAARTRSRDSRHEASGRPTMANDGRPSLTWASTRTGYPRAPIRVAEWATASTAASPATESTLRSTRNVGQPTSCDHGRYAAAGTLGPPCDTATRRTPGTATRSGEPDCVTDPLLVDRPPAR